MCTRPVRNCWSVLGAVIVGVWASSGGEADCSRVAGLAVVAEAVGVEATTSCGIQLCGTCEREDSVRWEIEESEEREEREERWGFMCAQSPYLYLGHSLA